MTETNPRIYFEEKQYLGYNKFNLSIRSTLAIFCFLSAFYADQDDPNAELFLIIGILILLLSLALIFVLHLHTKLENNILEISGFWNSRKVKVDMDNIIHCEKANYSKFLLNRPVYNLHLKGKIRFFTRGNDAVRLTDKDGLVYVIGSQRATELSLLINQKINQ